MSAPTSGRFALASPRWKSAFKRCVTAYDKAAKSRAVARVPVD
jgi:hypothetical protein